jgi:uncharacterized membrane protein YraQ (UPF0718 family)
MTEMLFKVIENVWHYTEEASPWLLLGFLFAGILKAFIPSGILLKYLGGSKFRSIITATLVGIPLPLCSCGVIPTGLSLYEQGASKPSTLAFLIARPIHICSTGSVPFVASLIAKGMNPAAGLVVLIVGPATNLSTMLVIGKTMGKKTAILYTTSIIVLSICFDCLFFPSGGVAVI